MYQAIWILIWERPQNYGLNHTEDRGIYSDSQAERKQANRRVTRRPTQLAKAKADVLQQNLKNWQPALNTEPLPDLAYSTKIAKRCRSRILFGHAPL
jgi:hypothetical protein